MDELLTAALQKSDPKERAAALKEAIQLSSQDIAVVPVFWPASAMAINKKYKLTGLHGLLVQHPLGAARLRHELADAECGHI